MTCPICGAKCRCRKASLICCSCHRHKARSPVAQVAREIAHAAAVPIYENRQPDPKLLEIELFKAAQRQLF